MANSEMEVGSLAPDFQLTSNIEDEISLRDYRGRKVILFFVREFN